MLAVGSPRRSFPCCADLQDTLSSNFEGTRSVLELAASAQCLKAMVHVSSAYVNINKPRSSVLDEQIYPLRMGKQAVDAEQIVKVRRSQWGGPDAKPTGSAAACMNRLPLAYMVEAIHTVHGILS